MAFYRHRHINNVIIMRIKDFHCKKQHARVSSGVTCILLVNFLSLLYHGIRYLIKTLLKMTMLLRCLPFAVGYDLYRHSALNPDGSKN